VTKGRTRRTSCATVFAAHSGSEANSSRAMRGRHGGGCILSFGEMCRFRYLVHVGGLGISGRLKQLLLCGSTVIYVANKGAFHEFYEAVLLAGVHVMHVETVAEVPAMVRVLRRTDAWARAVGAAGQRQMRRLDVEHYVLQLLRAIAPLQRHKPAVRAGAQRINCEDDLYRLMQLDGSGPKYWGPSNFLTKDPRLCIAPPKREPGEEVPCPGEWWVEPGQDYGRRWPRFFMPSAVAARRPDLLCGRRSRRLGRGRARQRLERR